MHQTYPDAWGVGVNADLSPLFPPGPKNQPGLEPIEFTMLRFARGPRAYRFSIEALPDRVFQVTFHRESDGHRVIVASVDHVHEGMLGTLVLPYALVPTRESVHRPALQFAVEVAQREVGRWDGTAPTAPVEAADPAALDLRVERVRRMFRQARRGANVDRLPFTFAASSDGTIWITTRSHLRPRQFDALLDGLERRVGDIPIVLADRDMQTRRLPRQSSETANPAYAAKRRVEEAFEAAQEQFTDLDARLNEVHCTVQGQILAIADGVDHSAVVAFLAEHLAGLAVILRDGRSEIRLPLK